MPVFVAAVPLTATSVAFALSASAWQPATLHIPTERGTEKVYRLTDILCVMFGVVAIPTFLLWRVRPKPPVKPGCCPCGYSLIGNESGTCPECGAETAGRPQI